MFFVAVTYFTHVKYTRLWMIDCAVCFFKLIFLHRYANEPPTEKLLTKHVIFCRCTSTVEIKMIFSLAPPKFSTKKMQSSQLLLFFKSNRIYWNSSHNWLLGGFLFGSEI